MDPQSVRKEQAPSCQQLMQDSPGVTSLLLPNTGPELVETKQYDLQAPKERGQRSTANEQGAELRVPPDPELAAYAARVLQRVQPDADLDPSSLRMLEHLLDEITHRVLDEAQRISTAQTSAAAPSKGKIQQAPPLTSLDIHKALKRVLPGGPGDRLRPYLPAEVKQAWHLDKQSLKGIKKQKMMGMEIAAGGSENDALVLAAHATAADS